MAGIPDYGKQPIVVTTVITLYYSSRILLPSPVTNLCFRSLNLRDMNLVTLINSYVIFTKSQALLKILYK